MTDRFDEQGRDAAAAVHERTAALGTDDGLAEVVRRGRRRKLGPPIAAVVGVVALVAVGVPVAGWISDAMQPAGIEVADAPSDPVPEEPAVDADVDDGTDVADDVVRGDDVGDADPDELAPSDVETEPSTGPDAVGAFSTDTVTTDGFPAGGSDIVELTDVRVAGQEGFDRIVLEFDGDQMSPYQVGYVPGPVRQDGSGNPVEVAGDSYLEVLLTAASGVVFDLEEEDGYRLSYVGPDRVTGDTEVVQEAVRTGDFEATLTWTLGLDGEAPFAVTVLESPLRLVIDVQHP